MPMLPIKFLTVHCSATPEGRDVKTATITAWDHAKFGQTSYHHVVELDGSDHVTLPDDVRGAHVGGNNTGNIGVCYVGGMDAQMAKAKDTRTAAQKLTLKNLIIAYQHKYPGIVVRGHRDWPNVHKDCPSFDVAAWIKQGMPI